MTDEPKLIHETCFIQADGSMLIWRPSDKTWWCVADDGTEDYTHCIAAKLYHLIWEYSKYAWRPDRA